MEKFDLDLNGSSSSDQKQSEPQEARKLRIQRCLQLLVHAYQCRITHCRLPDCRKMKRIQQHAMQCVGKAYGACPICKQLITFCAEHAKACQDTECPVPFCFIIKLTQKPEQLQQRLEQVQLFRRRSAIQNTQTPVPGGVLTGSSQTAAFSSTANMTWPHVRLVRVFESTNLSGICLNPGASKPPDDLVKQVQEVKHYVFLKPRAAGDGSQVMLPSQIAGSSGGRLCPVHLSMQQCSRLPSDYIMQQNADLRQITPQIIRQQVAAESHKGFNLAVTLFIQPKPQHGTFLRIANRPAHVLHKRAGQKSLSRLKSYKAPKQRAKIFSIWKSNCQSIAICQREVFQPAKAADQSPKHTAHDG